MGIEDAVDLGKYRAPGRHPGGAALLRARPREHPLRKLGHGHAAYPGISNVFDANDTNPDCDNNARTSNTPMSTAMA